MSMLWKRSSTGPSVTSQGQDSAQEMLKRSHNLSGWVRLKEPRYKRLSNKWPKRFVILGEDSVFIFDDEQSKTCKHRVMMLGFKAVMRFQSTQHEWCFSIVPGMDALKIITFSCASEKERTSWMVAVKTVMYSANRIAVPDSFYVETQKLISSTDNDPNSHHYQTIDDDFRCFEEPIFEPYVSPETQEDDDAKWRRMSSISSGSSQSGESGSGSFGSVTKELSHAIRKGKISKVDNDPPPSMVAPKLPFHKDYVNSKKPAQNLHDDDDDEDGYDYPPTLEDQCSMCDSGLSRQQLVDKIKLFPVGTYLLRNSRADSRKVLTVKSGYTELKELKVYDHDGRLTIDNKEYFNSIEEILQFYTARRNVPRTQIFLQKGIHYAQPLDDVDDDTYDKVQVL